MNLLNVANLNDQRHIKQFNCVDFSEYHKYSILIKNIRYSESYECSKDYTWLKALYISQSSWFESIECSESRDLQKIYLNVLNILNLMNDTNLLINLLRYTYSRYQSIIILRIL